MYITKEITERNIWDEHIARIKPDTFLHDWQWGETNQKNGHGVTRLGIYNENTELIAIALILTIPAKRGTYLFCPHGPIIDSKTQPEVEKELLASLTRQLKEMGAKEGASFIRISPLLSATVANDDMFYACGYKEAPIHMVHPELAWILDVRPSEEELLRGMRKSTRYSIKKAEKDGITVSISTNINDLETFWSVYSKTAERQQFTPFSKNYLKLEFESFTPQNAALFFSHYKNTVTATALVIFNETGGFYHHGATTQQYHGLTDAQLLQWEIIKECKRRSLSYYNFWGVVDESQKKHPWYGLSNFKRGFGGREEGYIHAKDLILGPRYYVTYILETLRKITRGL